MKRKDNANSKVLFKRQSTVKAIEQFDNGALGKKLSSQSDMADIFDQILEKQTPDKQGKPQKLDPISSSPARRTSLSQNPLQAQLNKNQPFRKQSTLKNIPRFSRLSRDQYSFIKHMNDQVERTTEAMNLLKEGQLPQSRRLSLTRKVFDNDKVIQWRGDYAKHKALIATEQLNQYALNLQEMKKVIED